MDREHIKVGALRGDKTQYPDGIGYCIWYPFEQDADEDIGICFDLSGEDIDDAIALLQQLKAHDVMSEVT